ncbi:MAG: FkbM family methyltransferase [Dehalococcoidales bacterium]
MEVGAATPDFLSMSKHFRDFGWRCVCIEPNPRYVQMHRDCGSEVYQFACASDDVDNVDFQIVHKSDRYGANEITDHSYSALQVKDAYLKHDNIQIESLSPVSIKVNVRKLDTVLSGLGIRHVDFLSIDVEGWELEVMKGFSTRAYRPKVILLENYTHSTEYVEYMRSLGYFLDKVVEYNYIFCRNRRGFLCSIFRADH